MMETHRVETEMQGKRERDTRMGGRERTAP